MTKWYSECESPEFICDCEFGEDERGQETDSEDTREEEVSDVEDNTEYEPDQETTGVEHRICDQHGVNSINLKI